MYPLLLNLKNKNIVVIGGGKVALRKVLGLLEEGGRITVICPVLNEGLKNLVQQQRIQWIDRTFEQTDLADAFIVIAATNERAVNAFVASCCQTHQLVNIVDDPDNSTFHVPAKVAHGNLVIAVSTGGSSPYLAKKIRDEIATIYTVDYAEYLDFLAEVRSHVLALPIDDVQRKAHLRESISEKFRYSKEARKQFLQQLY